jgi:transcriptional regulator with XRE-family HTH domain
MTAMGVGYMPLGRQLFGRSMAEALAALLAQRYRTAKELARAAGIDVATAENLRKGHLSITTLQKVLATEGRELWNRLGDELFGETFYDYEERRIEAAIKEVEGARTNLVRLRSQAAELLASAPRMDQAGLGSAADTQGRDEPRSWDRAGGAGNPGTPRSRNRGGR